MAKIYYRSIIGGSKTINDVPSRWVDQVKALFAADVASGLITKEQYKEYTGEDYGE